MARPIRETPILYGEDARRFLENMKIRRPETPEARAQRLRDYKFIRLDPTNGVKAFNCGDVDLDDFILNRASIFQKHLLAVSYAYVDDASKVYAYCSLANDRVALDNFRDKTEFNRFRKKSGFPNEKRLKSYPAVKLCRLGVDVSAKKQRIGTTILNYIKSMFVIDNKTGCRFLTVDVL